MSKKQYSPNNSDPSDSEVYEVEKIVNQRIINGKKQYKVIWAGYSFQEATWEPQENLKCPQKISEFLRRYQDVIRRKNLMNKNSNDPNVQSIQKIKVNETQKTSIQKVQPSLQKSLVTQSSNVNKEKLQSSLQKSSVTYEKKVPDIQNLKSKIMGPKISLNTTTKREQQQNPLSTKISGIGKTYQSNEQILINQSGISQSNESKNTTKQFVISKMVKNFDENNKAPKIIKIQSQSQNKSDSFDNKVFSKIESKLQSETFQNSPEQKPTKKVISQSSKTTRGIINLENGLRVNQIVQERKISQESSQSDSRSQENQSRNRSNDIFLKVGERLDIQKIFGPINFMNLQTQQIYEAGRQPLENPKFFLIKNKFSAGQKIVEKQRIILEQPLELISFYESLLCE